MIQNAITIERISHHPNGVKTESFYVVRFTSHALGRTFIATYFPVYLDTGEIVHPDAYHECKEACNRYGADIAIICVNKLPAIDAEFNSWNADHYRNEIHDAVAQYAYNKFGVQEILEGDLG